MAHVFISYAHQDADFAAILKMQLEKSDIPCWVDVERLRVGEDWRQSIDAAILGSFAVIAIITPAADQSKYVTYEWAYALGANKKVIPLLLQTAESHPRIHVLQHLDFTHHDNRPWNRLINELRQIEQDAAHHVHVPPDAPQHIKGALEALNNWDPEVRRRAAEWLAQKRHEAVVPALATILRDDADLVRETAVIALGNTGDPAALSPLIHVFRNSTADLRLFAVQAIGKLRDPAIVPILVDTLYEDDREIRYIAEESLLKIMEANDPVMSNALSESMFTLVEALRDDDFDVRNTAANALSKIATRAILPDLIEILQSSNRDAGYAAAHVLSNLDLPQAQDALQRWRKRNKIQPEGVDA